VYKTCTTNNTITHCRIEYHFLQPTPFELVGVREWMREDLSIGRYQVLEHALEKSKMINCQVGK
jgi:hypothetical protein